MPELPEVETIVRNLRPQLVSQTILKAELRWARTLAIPSPRRFREQIAGRKILEVSHITNNVVNVVIITPSVASSIIGLVNVKLSTPITFNLRIINVGVKKGIKDRTVTSAESGS